MTSTRVCEEFFIGNIISDIEEHYGKRPYRSWHYNKVSC